MRKLFHIALFGSLFFVTGCALIEDDEEFVDQKSWTEPDRNFQPGIGI